MAKWISAGKGIRYREHEIRKHGKRPDRYWCIQYKLNGKTINEAVGWWSQGASQAECEQLLSRLRENWRTGEGPQTLKETREHAQAAKETARLQKEKADNSGLTLAEFWEKKYYPHAALHKAANSVRTELLFFTKWLTPLADMPLQEITKEIVAEEVVKPIMQKGLSPRTVEYALATISQVWNMANDYGVVSGENPVRKIKKPKKDNQRVRFLTEDEAGALLADLKTRSQDVHDVTLLSLFTGMRPDECLSLTWADINLNDKNIFVKDTKTDRNRHAFMTAEVEKMFRSRFNNQAGNALVFPTTLGQKNQWGISESFNRAVNELGFNEGISDRRQKVVFYTLRHTFASWLVQKGVPLYNVSQLMGHSDMQMTKRYAHLAPDNQKAATKVLEGILGAK